MKKSSNKLNKVVLMSALILTCGYSVFNSAGATDSSDKKSEQPTQVVKTEQEKGAVYVKYVTTDGKVLKERTPILTNLQMGVNYSVNIMPIKGYKFKELAKDSAPYKDGIVNKKEVDVVFVMEADGTATDTNTDKKDNNTPSDKQVDKKTDADKKTTDEKSEVDKKADVSKKTTDKKDSDKRILPNTQAVR